jgi:hypothetical protein
MTDELLGRPKTIHPFDSFNPFSSGAQKRAIAIRF